MTTSLQFWIFSFNRGRFLENCIRSIEQCAPHCSISVFDDRSNDPATREILERIASKHPVVYPDSDSTGESKHGGLYNNMQAALDQSGEEGMVCFLQDDMQLVRSLAEAEVDAIGKYFAHHPEAGFIRPVFFKLSDQKENEPVTRYLPSARMYWVDRFQRSAGAAYSDVFVAPVKRLRAVDWKFLPREKYNEQQARRMFPQMAYLRDPFVAWLPNPPTYRGRRQTLGLSLAQRRHHSGFYPFRIMSPQERSLFLDRDPARLPYAEHFLRPATTQPHAQPWIYHPLQSARCLKVLHNIEDRLRRFKQP